MHSLCLFQYRRFAYYWNDSASGVIETRVADNIKFVLLGGDGVDGLFTDEVEMFP